MKIEAVPGNPIKRTLMRVLLFLRLHAWIVDNYWLRFSGLRHAVLMALFRFGNVLGREGFGRKAAAVSQFLDSFIADPGRARYFTGADGSDGECGGYLVTAPLFRDGLLNHIMNITLRDEERLFRLDDLAAVEKDLLAGRKKTGHAQRVFTRERREEFDFFFGAEKSGTDLPESYIRLFFPDFDPSEFVRNGASFVLGRRCLFSPGEARAVIDFFSVRLRMRNPRSLAHRAAPVLKKTFLAACVLFYAVFFLFDLAIALYGTSRNDYNYSFQNFSQTIETCDSPFARRAERIYRRNRGARFDEFSATGSAPAAGNVYRINNRSQMAVELNYGFYRSLRIQDQNGLTVVAVDRQKLRDLARSDPDRYRGLMDLIIDRRWWESILAFADDLTGNRTALFDRAGIPHDRICDDLTKGIMKSAEPVEWINRLNGTGDCIALLYYKANSMKWAGIGEIPRVMIEGVILREDRRFRNAFFPVPHRGNDNLVIIPQITKKVLRKVLREIRAVAAGRGIPWLEKQSGIIEDTFAASFREDARGGSSISNQVMEMLYTKYITAIAEKPSFPERQIEQKKYELPASATVDWFWTRNDILEAYVNEVYGGHLYSDIRGFRSQAEMYFMKGLHDLNLREQVMLVAAIKKPSRIKEYAAFLKAEELRDLLESKRPSREAVEKWTDENGPYRVDRKNYREILESKLRAKLWIEGRMRSILRLLRGDGVITAEEERDAWSRQKVRFRFAPGIYSIDNRLVNNIKREIDRELGADRSDSGLVVVTTVDMAMQKKLQALVDRKSRWISVDPDCQVEGQPSDVFLEGGARIIHAHRKARSGRPEIVNRIIADVGGTTRNDDEWDWISLANRSLGSSLKPILDLYFILSGYNLQDMFRNSPVTYKTYSLEQQKVFQNFIHKYPKRTKEIEGIEKYWSWSPRNFTEYTNDWVTVEDALVHSINGIHVQIQELVTPATFARLLNETMNITEPDGKHRPYRSIILGGSSGDQRYDRYLLAYSMFPNLGVVRKHTFIETMRRSDGAVMRPDYRPLKVPLLDHFGADRVRAACQLIDHALRETVKRGTMAGMEGIGAGKTGTSNELRDAMATVHFIAGDSTYIAGVRLGNRRNYSIGRAADRIAVPMLHDIVTGTFKRDMIMGGDDYDEFLKRLGRSSGEIVRVREKLYLKGNYQKPRRLEITRTKEEIRNRRLAEADAYYKDRDYEEAARSYEDFLALAEEFNARHPAFERMVHCCIKTGNLKRAAQIIERFSLPGRIWSTARGIERKYDAVLKVDEDFYSGDHEFERRKREKDDAKKRKRRGGDEVEAEEAIPDEIKNHMAPHREEKQADTPEVPQEKKAEPPAEPEEKKAEPVTRPQEHKDAPPAQDKEQSD